jgi:NADH-quinone oxidoreductase subunit J
MNETEVIINVNKLLFFSLSVFSTSFALLVITRRNTLHSVLFLIMTISFIVPIMVMLKSDLLAYMYLIVYVGAIAIFFMFGIMMLNIKSDHHNSKRYSNRTFPLFVAINSITYAIYKVDEETYLYPPETNDFSELHNSHVDYINIYYEDVSDLERFGQLIYTEYFIIFIIIGLILFLAMVASISLTLEEKKIFNKKQDIFNQVTRSQLSIFRVKS